MMYSPSLGVGGGSGDATADIEEDPSAAWGSRTDGAGAVNGRETDGGDNENTIQQTIKKEAKIK